MGADDHGDPPARPLARSTASLARVSAEIDERDGYTAGHSMRVRTLSLQIGEQLELEPDALDVLARAALFHDVGKHAIPDEVLLKPTRLDEHEWAVMRTHSLEGARLASVEGLDADAVDAIRHHHERFDGSGYPDGLRGEEIPLLARIIHVADAVDSMVTTRVYRTAATVGDALDEVRRMSGSQFCPRCGAGFELVVRTLADGQRRARRRLVSLGAR